MASSSAAEKKRRREDREREEALETLEHIRFVGEEVRDYPELLFWCPVCGLPGSRSTGEWAACFNHPHLIVTCGLPACWRRVHRCHLEAETGCRSVLCPDCADGSRAFERCFKCRTLVCHEHSEPLVVGDPTVRDRVCKKCSQ